MAQPGQRDQPAKRELPDAGLNQEERRSACGDAAVYVANEGKHDHGQHDRRELQACARRPPEEQRPREVELLLDAERPQLQQWFVETAFIKIPLFVVVEDVFNEARGARDVLAQTPVFQCEHVEPAQHCRKQQDDAKRRKYAAYATRVKVADAEGVLLQAGADIACDQVAGNDEEDIHANKPARDPVR